MLVRSYCNAHLRSERHRVAVKHDLRPVDQLEADRKVARVHITHANVLARAARVARHHKGDAVASNVEP